MKIILGTMNFGPQLDMENSRIMVSSFLRSGYKELDTAYVYNEGVTEKYLGNILAEIHSEQYSIATKIHPRITGKLDKEAILLQLGESLKRMYQESVDILYFHFPDQKTPISEALETCAELYEQKKIKELGLSNFPSWLVADVWHLCDRYGCPRPTVYQGMYNALCRNVEGELFPALRHFGIRFYVFNPLAGGLLTGKHLSFEASPMPGRFSRLQSYRNRYWKKSNFEAINLIKTKCQEEGILLVEAAFRWLVHHSFLDRDKGDGIVLGASRQEQMEQNIEFIKKNALPDSVINAYNEAWEEVKKESPSYFNFFNMD
jgi:aflatoxin B1 aldehyde reductase